MKTNLSKRDEIEKTLAVLQIRSQTRTVTYDEIQILVARIEDTLKTLGIPKKLWDGMRFRIDANAQKFPNAYKYEPMSTIVKIQRFSKDWFIVDIARARCEERKVQIETAYTDEQKQAILIQARKF